MQKLWNLGDSFEIINPIIKPMFFLFEIQLLHAKNLRDNVDIIERKKWKALETNGINLSL